MPDISSPPERTEELVERVALAMFLVAREEPGNEIYEESFEDMQLGDQNFARRLARAALQSSGYAEMERENAELSGILSRIVGNANEAPRFGPFDQIDNCGEPYQSQALHDALEAGRKYFARTALRGDREQGEG